jgi:hypothetical protein
MTIMAKEKAAEIFVLDGNLNMATGGIGTVQTELPEGIHKIKLRAGVDTHEDLVVHRLPRTDKQYPLLHFSSPAPLTFTRESSPAHAEEAKRESRAVHVDRGSGRSIFVFARDWLHAQGPSPVGLNPAEDLSRELGGRSPRRSRDASDSAERRGRTMGCVHDRAQPSLYRLSVRLSNGEVFVQSIEASPGWTQVFMLQRQDYRRTSGEPKLDLGSAAILMLGSIVFEPHPPDVRMAELAQQALMNRRPNLKRDPGNAPSEGPRPHAGRLAGHLLLREPAPDLRLLTIVVQNLRSLLRAQSRR